MNDWTDLQIRVRGALESNGIQSRHEVEAQMDGSGIWTGISQFDFAVADPSKLSPQDYGTELGRQLVNQSVEHALDYAGATNGKPVRLRLFLEAAPSAPHAVRWERMYLPSSTGAPWPAAISPTVPFSRYIPVQMPDGLATAEPVFRLLVAVSNPSNIDVPVDVEGELASFVTEFEKARALSRLEVTILPGRTGVTAALADRIKALHWKLETGPASLENIGTISGRSRSHGIHLISHGDFKAGRSQGILYLEGPDGTLQKVVDDDLKTWVTPLLRLALFECCKSAAPAPADQEPFVGVAAKMVAFGVPAVVAMQDFVPMDDARTFAAAFYRDLMEDGRVDVAVNTGRRAIASKGGDWSIPALFLRLADGKLWTADPVREAVWSDRLKIFTPPGVPETLPLKVVQQADGIEYNPLDEPVGAVFELDRHVRSLLEKNARVCLTGPAGSHKTEQLQRLYCLLADEFMQDSSKPAPVWTEMQDLARQSPGSAVRSNGGSIFEQALSAVIAGNKTPAILAKRRFVFLVYSEQDLAANEVRMALRALRSLTDTLDATCVFLFDDTNLAALSLTFAKAAVLIVRPLEIASLRSFLNNTGRASDKSLRTIIDDRGLGDLASAPWVLMQMRELVRFGHTFNSRGEVLELIADNFLSGFGSRGIPRSCAIAALRSLAWTIQNSRNRFVENMDLWRILEEARGARDFSLTEFRDALLDAKLLMSSGDEAACLRYKAICGYYAARYLMDSPKSQEVLENITASLGRLSRLRHWEETLVMFAGLQRSTADRERVLQTLLAGSSLIEGEQVFLAARLYVEMKQCEKDDGVALRSTAVVQQIVDTLIWRSRADLPRPYQDRRLAMESLASMRHPAAIPHLVSVACDQIRPDSGNPAHNSYDLASVRMIAVGGLFDQPLDTQKYVDQDPVRKPALGPLLQAWESLWLNSQTGPMVELLKKNDPSVSTIAAFAFALQKDKFEDNHPLLDAFWDPKTNGDVLWGINEVLGTMDSAWLREKIILPWIAKKPGPVGRLCYLIQKSMDAAVGSKQRKYLEECLQDKFTAPRAIRALAKMPEKQDTLRAACHQILQKDWAGLNKALGVPVPADEQQWSLQHAALESLRDVGDETTVDLLRAIRTTLDNVLVQLSFQVGEEIYWRCTGGLAKETYGPQGDD